MLKGRHLIEPGDFTLEEMNRLFDLAKQIEVDQGFLRESCRGKVLATLFFEPSTRTRLSFEAAMLRLGGSCLGFAEPIPVPLPKGRIWQIPYARFPVMRMLLSCVTPRRVLRWWRPGTPLYR
jgi:hypothetical protein